MFSQLFLLGSVLRCIRSISASSPLKVVSGGNDNYLLRDQVTTSQILLSSRDSQNNARRYIVALPAGNSGGLTYFLPTTDRKIAVNLVDGSLQSTTEAYNNIGVQADLSFNGNATVGVTIVGAIRAIRDYVEGSGMMHEIFNYTLLNYSTTSVRLHHRYIDPVDLGSANPVYKSADFYFSIPPDSKASLSVTPSKDNGFTPPLIKIIVPANQPSSAIQSAVRFRVLTNETSLVGLDTGDLFLTEEQAQTAPLKKVVQGLADGSKIEAKEMSFLTYSDKFTAGGWRFLTYFGRDSLIALRLLMPTMKYAAIETVLGAAIERANITGALCHEETIGDYASFVNANNGHKELGNTPFYDYKMIDTDHLLLPAMSHYFLEMPQGRDRAPQFLAKKATLQQGTYGEILDRILKYNIGRAMPFYSKSTHENLIAFRPGQPVGNWRDSNQGTGFGPIPFDVNTALVPASLRAHDYLVQAGILPKPDFSSFTNDKEVNLDKLATAWEEKTLSFFEVCVAKEEAQNRVDNFIRVANLSKALLDSSFNNDTVNFYALSLMADGKKVEVLNSDISFNLVYGNAVKRQFLQHVVDALRPYPQGLLTNVGMLIANPAYDSNITNIGVFSRSAYHGTVVWSFQQGLMASGLARQLGFCSKKEANPDPYPDPKSGKPEWCLDEAFVKSLQDARDRLWVSIRGAQSQIYSEVWSYGFDQSTNKFSVVDLSSLTPEGTESDAIQLWSYGFLALLDPSGNSSEASS